MRDGPAVRVEMIANGPPPPATAIAIAASAAGGHRPGPRYRRPPMTAPVAPVALRLATRADAEALRAIYNVEVTTSTVTFDLVPRSLADQLAWIDAHSGAHPAVVAERQGQVVGFGSLSPYRDRPGYRTTVEDSVYVDRAHQGLGVGRAVLEELVSLATSHGFHAMMARIVDGHHASIALHRACGFTLVGVEKEVGRKFGTWLDVALMQRLL